MVYKTGTLKLSRHELEIINGLDQSASNYHAKVIA